MSDLTEFLLVMAGLYLAECVIRAPRGAVAFLQWSWSGWHILKGSSFYGNPRWGLFMANPIPGMEAAFLCELWPVSLSPDGVYSYVAQTFNPGQRHEQPAQFHRFEDIGKVEWADRSVLINGTAFVTTASPLFARRLSGLIQQIRRLPHQDRAAVIDAALREALNLHAIRTRYDEFHAATSWLDVFCKLLFGLFFVVLPFVAWRYGLGLTWPFLLLGLIVLVGLVLISYVRAHRRLYPDWKSDRWSHLAVMALLPLAAIRAPAFLARDLLAVFHPLAVAWVLCSQERFLDFAGSVLRDIEHPVSPVCPSEEFGPAETEKYFRLRLSAALNEVLVREGVDLGSLKAPPLRDGDDHLSYCPRCHCQFIVAGGECQTCNLPLIPFAT